MEITITTAEYAALAQTADHLFAEAHEYGTDEAWGRANGALEQMRAADAPATRQAVRWCSASRQWL